VGENGSEIRLDAPGEVSFSVDCAALVDPEQFEDADADEIEVELIANGYPIATKKIPAHAAIHSVTFDVTIDQSSWVAVRIHPHAHSNPIWVTVNDQPVRASKASAEWCLRSVEQCWIAKRPTYSIEELDAARTAYEHARNAYKRILAEATE